MFDTNVVIRLVEQKDAEHLFKNCFSMSTLERTQERVARNLQAFGEGKAVQLVAEIIGEVVGTVMVMRKAHPLEAHRAEVFDLVVHPDYQQRGIARRLVEESKSYAKDMGVDILEIGSRGGTVAETVHRHLGFVEWGRLPRGFIESRGEHKVYDAVYFYQLLAEPES